MKNLAHPQSFRIGKDNLHQMVEALVEPVFAGLSIFLVSLWFEGQISPASMITAILVFALLFPGKPRLQMPVYHAVFDITTSWISIFVLILFFGWASETLKLFQLEAVLTWLWLGGLVQVSSHVIFRYSVRWIFAHASEQDRTVIVGMNSQGIELAKRVTNSPYYNNRVMGFFFFFRQERLSENTFPLLGNLNALSAYCKEHRIKRIYISLPMTTQPRILAVLDDLADTTASIFFVPDIFVTDLIQGHIHHIENMPVVSVCDTPFTGMNGLLKRSSDIIISTLILCLISPLLVIIGAAVKISSKGPIIFKQRRYGLDGEEIVVYKFRSMTVCEDGATIAQAKKDDTRVTPLGAFLRKSSLDELPQFFNVLQGRMSIVGPRPHAVAHNELYRKLIKGYMVRHKVKPGITGWAQVNGLRGETETLERMQARIEHDLDYLRNWSLVFDLRIILKTIGVLINDQHAY
ncbi:MAG: undecaprenyl-phosphate glucose phosphotransferase [Pseudomonadales bacterium]|nr:undecaprenyl-phosphate glucose phosphotransferase [Pseudomonadales bacterium]